MKTQILVLALSLSGISVAFAQNPTTAPDLTVPAQVHAPGSMLNQEEHPRQTSHKVVNDDAADRPIPAGLAPDASTPRENFVNELNVATPVQPLGQTRPDPNDIEQPVPLGAQDNGYRPSSSAGYYDTDDTRHKPVTPSIVPDPAPVPPPPNTVPPGFNLYERPE